VAYGRRALEASRSRATRQAGTTSRARNSYLGKCRPSVVHIGAAGPSGRTAERRRVAPSSGVASSCLRRPRVPWLRLSTPTRLAGASPRARWATSSKQLHVVGDRVEGVATNRHERCGSSYEKLVLVVKREAQSVRTDDCTQVRPHRVAGVSASRGVPISRSPGCGERCAIQVVLYPECSAPARERDVH
jgi:hypothetical protein